MKVVGIPYGDASPEQYARYERQKREAHAREIAELCKQHGIKVNLHAVASRIELRHFMIPMKLIVKLRETDASGPFPGMFEWDLVLCANIRDRDTGKPIWLDFSATMTTEFVDEMSFPIERWIFDHVERFLRHELEEAFHVDGKRIYDPHV